MLTASASAPTVSFFFLVPYVTSNIHARHHFANFPEHVYVLYIYLSINNMYLSHRGIY